MEVDGPDAELIALLTEHVQALLEEQGREFEGGGGGPGELVPHAVLRLQQQHKKLDEALTFLRMLTGARSAGEVESCLTETGFGQGEREYDLEKTRSLSGETESRPGETGLSARERGVRVGGPESSRGERKDCLGSWNPGGRGALASAAADEGVSCLDVDREGHNPTAGVRQPGHPTAQGDRSAQERNRETGALDIQAKERLFATRLALLQQRKPAHRMTGDDYVELMRVFSRTSPATWHLPEASVAPASGVADPAPRAATNSLTPSSPGSLRVESPGSGVKKLGSGAKRAPALDLNLAVSLDSSRGLKRGATDVPRMSGRATGAGFPGRSWSPSLDGRPDISPAEGSSETVVLDSPSLSLSLSPPGNPASGPSALLQRIDLNRAPG